MIRYLILALLLLSVSFNQYAKVPSVAEKMDIINIDATKSLFPIELYSQDVNKWLPPASSSYKQPILSEQVQKAKLEHLVSHYYGKTVEDKSPWNFYYINTLLGKNGIAQQHLDKQSQRFTQEKADYFGANYRKLNAVWKNEMGQKTSVQLTEKYNESHRAIIIRETAVRLLPTEQPAFIDFRKPGEGYPFDMLQDSSLHPGEPIYIFAKSPDQAWNFIVSPTVIGWIRDSDMARVDAKFVNKWIAQAQSKIGAFIKEPVSVIDEQGLFRFQARIGTILPFIADTSMVAIPVRNKKGSATIGYAPVSTENFVSMPFSFTPENIAKIMKEMIGKTYGWGNLYGYNDCSAELRNIMLPLGLFLPRNSLEQSSSGEQTDLSHLSTEERLNYLKEHGQPFVTLIYVNGHTMLYIGNTEWQGKSAAITYQNVWGLRPTDRSMRSIIGQSVFLPLLKSYPEDPLLESQAGREKFILTRLD